jgi:hypothetical protein
MVMVSSGTKRTDQYPPFADLEAPADDPETRRGLAPLRVLTVHYYLESVYEELGPTKFIAVRNSRFLLW